MRAVADRLLALGGLMTVVGFGMALVQPHDLLLGGWTTGWIIAFTLMVPAMVGCILLALALLTVAVVYITTGREL